MSGGRLRGGRSACEDAGVPIFEMTSDRLIEVPATTFAEAGVRERYDLQKLVREHVEAIYPECVVIAEEFGDFETSGRRIDLLAVHASGDLVVIELKRTEDGGHMELQAIRYAAMVSAMTWRRAVDIYAGHLRRLGREGDAESLLLEFLEWDEPREADFARRVRVVLASADFGRELTTAVLWLNEQGLDITCVQMRPHTHDGKLLLDVRQVIPLPEATDYQEKIKDKVQKERSESNETERLRLRWWEGLLPRAAEKTPLHANLSPQRGHFISTPAGVRGLTLGYVVRRHDSRVELYIDRGRGFESFNKGAFDSLHSSRDAIEQAFGGPLNWERLDGKRAARVSFADVGGYQDAGESWGEAHDRLIDAMVRLEAALRPHLSGLE